LLPPPPAATRHSLPLLRTSLAVAPEFVPGYDSPRTQYRRQHAILMLRAVAARLVTAAEDVGVAVVRLADAPAPDAVIATDDAVLALAVLAIPPIVVAPPQLLRGNDAPTPAVVAPHGRRCWGGATYRAVPGLLLPFR
jgi:hypothetical protein